MRIGRWRGLRNLSRQTFALIGIENRLALEEWDGAFGIFA
jgi:hypothetical protein